MKKHSWLIGLLGILAACNKPDEDIIVDQGVFPAKIIQTICGEAVLEIMDEDYYHLGQLDWTWGEITHHHVFFTQFNCDDLESFSQLNRPSLIGLDLQVKIIQQDLGDCVRCEATISDPPSIKHYIDVIF